MRRVNENKAFASLLALVLLVVMAVGGALVKSAAQNSPVSARLRRDSTIWVAAIPPIQEIERPLVCGQAPRIASNEALFVGWVSERYSCMLLNPSPSGSNKASELVGFVPVPFAEWAYSHASSMPSPSVSQLKGLVPITVSLESDKPSLSLS